MENILSLIHIATPKSSSKNSDGQGQYNKLLKDLEKATSKIANIKNRISTISKNFYNDLMPFRQDLADTFVNNIALLEKHLLNKNLHNIEFAEITEMILNKAQFLIESLHDERGIEIMNRHAPKCQQKENLEEDTKEDIEDEDEAEDFSFFDDDYASYINTDLEDKSDHQLNLEADCRDIYRSLVKKLHPDREQDEKAKDSKTELLKRITVAYTEKDIFILLKFKEIYLDADETASIDSFNLAMLTHELELKLEKLKYEEKSLKKSSEYKRFYGKTQKNVDQKIAKLMSGIHNDINHAKQESHIYKSFKKLRNFLYDESSLNEELDVEDILAAIMGRRR
jgi:hypothetical protein